MTFWLGFLSAPKKRRILVLLRILSGLVLIAIGRICAVGYIKDDSYFLAATTGLMGLIGIGVLLKHVLALKVARVVYCLLSAAILSMILLPHPPGDSAHRSALSLVSQLAVALLGILSFPALKGDEKHGTD